MAEAIVVALIQKISEITINQTLTYGGSLRNIPSQMADVKRELELMRVFLRYADMRNNNELVDAWANEVRGVAFQIEDVVDEYTFLTVKLLAQGGRFRVFIHNTVNSFKINKRLHAIANRLRDIDNSLSRLSACGERYQISRLEGKPNSSIASRDLSRQLAENAHFMAEHDIVGRHENKQRLAEWLMDGQPQLKLVAVWGMGGVGKTMLVTNAYNATEVVRRFILRAWFSVSQHCVVNDVLRGILMELHKEKEALPPNLDLMDYRALVETLRSILHQKRYLIILDDIWDRTVWSRIQHALVDDDSGSRIVITTRNMDVASVADEGMLMQLEPLNDDDARQLFHSIAFRMLPDERCPSEWEGSAGEIVKSCEGLPLALVCLGNLAAQRLEVQRDLSSLQDIHERVTNSFQGYGYVDSEEADDFRRVHAILDLSISYLPYYLRNCFLYCSAFPRGRLIKRKTLIRMWVSAGFVEERFGSTVEEAAERYLDQLICRCLLQDVKRNLNARVKRIKVHDLVHDVIVKKSRKEALFDAYEARSTRRQAANLVRHLSLIDVENIQAIKNMQLPQLRSFHVFSSTPFSLPAFRFKWLGILNLQNAPIKGLPHDLVHLFNLRYLSIRGTKVSKLPRGIGNLRNLVTLDAISSQITFLPKEITKLENLRHLMAFTLMEQRSGHRHMQSSVKIPKGVWGLRNLQTLKCVLGDKYVHHLRNIQIKTLHVDVTTNTALLKLCDSISSMSNLLNLKIGAFTRPPFRKRSPSRITTPKETSNRIIFAILRVPFRALPNRMIPLKRISSPPPRLQKLALIGRLENEDLPNWFNSLTNLTKLDLLFSGLEHDSIIQLNLLPQLVKLKLWKAYDGGILCIPPTWLPRLKSISLAEMDHLKTIKIGTNALQSLETMYLGSCRKLKNLPVGIRNLANMKELMLDDMPIELVLEIRYYGDDVQHIPRIENWYRQDGNWKHEVLVSQNSFQVPPVEEQITEQTRQQIGITGQQNAESDEQSQSQITAAITEIDEKAKDEIV